MKHASKAEQALAKQVREISRMFREEVKEKRQMSRYGYYATKVAYPSHFDETRLFATSKEAKEYDMREAIAILHNRYMDTIIDQIKRDQNGPAVKAIKILAELCGDWEWEEEKTSRNEEAPPHAISE